MDSTCRLYFLRYLLHYRYTTTSIENHTIPELSIIILITWIILNIFRIKIISPKLVKIQKQLYYTLLFQASHFTFHEFTKKISSIVHNSLLGYLSASEYSHVSSANSNSNRYWAILFLLWIHTFSSYRR